MLTDGSTASCQYDFVAVDRGVLRLPEAFFTAHGSTVHSATLELSDRSRKTVNVVMDPQVGEATFSVVT